MNQLEGLEGQFYFPQNCKTPKGDCYKDFQVYKLKFKHPRGIHLIIFGCYLCTGNEKLDFSALQHFHIIQGVSKVSSSTL